MGRELIQSKVLSIHRDISYNLPIVLTPVVFVRQLLAVVELDIGYLLQVWVALDNLPDGVPFVDILLD